MNLKAIFAASVLFAVSQSAQALLPPIETSQSSPSLEWNSIDNNSVRLIYPNEIAPESAYIANLVEHYSHVVGQTYGIQKPKRFSLLIRPEMAEPNGFVTLMPRRSEWFSSSMFSPLVGSTEWYQALAIHEYRHVNQFDHFNQRGTKVLYTIMGEFGWALASALALPSWYMEGDAVWAETKYTDAGRGRSPRFIARLKALALSGDTLTFEQFVNGSYRTDLPNYYVYGYALISYGTQKYGEDIWARVTKDAAKFPYPLRFYVSFKNVTGQTFRDFYYETMAQLRQQWSKDAPLIGETRSDFRDQSAPYKLGNALYFVKQTMKTYPEIIRRENGKETVVARIPYHRELNSIDMRGENAVYGEFLPDERYQYRGSSDLVLINLKSGARTRITSDQRLYNPMFNEAGTRILAVEFRADHTWGISEFDLSGRRLQTFNIANSKVAQARYLDDSTAVVLLNSNIGMKSIVTVDLKSHQVTKTLLEPSRNLLHSLFVDKNKGVFFEAQYKGANEIFRFSGSDLTRCTTSRIASYTPSSDGQTLYYASTDTDGSVIAESPLSLCTQFAAGELLNYKYIGDTPSDNFNKFPPQPIPNHAALFTNNKDQYQPKHHGDLDRQLFIPHTWGFMLGRGGGLGIETDNYLRTLGILAEVGTDPEELGPYAAVSVDFKKYYPLVRLQAETRQRDVEEFGTENDFEWTENTIGTSVLIPYIKQRGLSNYTANLVADFSYLDTSDYKFNEVETSETGPYFYKSGVGGGLSWNRNLKRRSIIAPWLASYGIKYEDADQPGNDALSSSRLIHRARLNVPGFYENDGFMFTFDRQDQTNGATGYRFRPEGSALGYVLSRGYSYDDTPSYEKFSANYFIPLVYPDFDLGSFYYLRRVYASTFFDSTIVEGVTRTRTLNSYGAELNFESQFFRFFPVTFGGRVYQRLFDSDVRFDAFIGSMAQF